MTTKPTGQRDLITTPTPRVREVNDLDFWFSDNLIDWQVSYKNQLKRGLRERKNRTYRKIRKDQHEDIRNDRKNGMPLAKLRNKYGGSVSNISKICKDIPYDKKPVLGWDKVRQIRLDREDGMLLKDIAEKYGCSRSQVGKIVRRDVWVE